MKTQETWTSPAAWLQSSTALIKQQVEGLSDRLKQLQAIISDTPAVGMPTALDPTGAIHADGVGGPLKYSTPAMSSLQQPSPVPPAWARHRPGGPTWPERPDAQIATGSSSGSTSVPVAVASGASAAVDVAPFARTPVPNHAGDVRVGATSVPLGRVGSINEVSAGRLCPSGHALVKFVTPQDGFVCNVCNALHARGSAMIGCRPCNYDACTSCVGQSTTVTLPDSPEQGMAARTAAADTHSPSQLQTSTDGLMGSNSSQLLRGPQVPSQRVMHLDNPKRT